MLKDLKTTYLLKKSITNTTNTMKKILRNFENMMFLEKLEKNFFLECDG